MATILKQLIFHDVLQITLNRPEKRNALSPELVEEFHAELDDIQNNPQIKALIITGAGKAFCAGADLAYLKKLSQFSPEENLQDSRRLAELFQRLYQLPRLTIAMVNGPALAGGCGLATCCDYIFADQENARFGFTEVRIGFVPAIVMNFLQRKIAPNHAYELVLSGKIISAAQAQSIGLINQSFPSEELSSGTYQFLDKLLSQNSFSAMMQTKRLYQQLRETTLAEGVELASRTNAVSRQTADCQKGLQAFLNKEKIVWRT